MIRAGLAAFLLAGSGTSAEAGAWTLAEDTGEAIVTGTFSDAGRYFDRQGRILRGPTGRTFERQATVGYGLTDWLTGLASSSYGAASSGAEASRRGAAAMGLRARVLADENAVVSLQGLIGWSSAFGSADPAKLWRDGEAEIRILFGRSFSIGAWPSFVDLHLAYRLRPGPPAGEVRADLTFGIRPLPEWLLLAQSFNGLAVAASPAVSKGTRYHKLKLGAVWDFARHWSLELAGVATVAGEVAVAERGLVAGLWYRF